MVKSTNSGQTARPEGVTEPQQTRSAQFLNFLSREVASDLMTALDRELDGGGWRGVSPADDLVRDYTVVQTLCHTLAGKIINVPDDLLPLHKFWYQNQSAHYHLWLSESSYNLHSEDRDWIAFAIDELIPIDADWAADRRAAERRLSVKLRKGWKTNPELSWSGIELIESSLYKISDIDLVANGRTISADYDRLMQTYFPTLGLEIPEVQ